MGAAENLLSLRTIIALEDNDSDSSYALTRDRVGTTNRANTIRIASITSLGNSDASNPYVDNPDVPGPDQPVTEEEATAITQLYLTRIS